MGIPAYPGVCCSSFSLCMNAWHECVHCVAISSTCIARPEGPRGHGIDAEVWGALEVAFW